MHIVTIGSDKTLVGASGMGDAVLRHRRYGNYVDSLDIIVYTNYREGFRKFMIAPNVIGHPSNSWGKTFFIIDALRIFRAIVRMHPIHIVIAQDPFVFALLGCFLKFLYGVKLEINFHGDFLDNPSWLAERWINHLFLPLARYTLSRADAIRVVARGIQEKLIHHGIPADRIVLIPTPIDISKFQSFDAAIVSQLHARYGHAIVLFVGRFEAVKNISMLLEAFLLLRRDDPAARLLLVGDGSERKNIESFIAAHKLSDVASIIDPVSHKQLADYYHAADVLVLSSVSEGLPKVLVEGGSCGLPIVATAVGGVPEVVRNGENGFLVPSRDVVAFAAKLLLLLRDVSLRHTMGEASALLMRQQFGDTTLRLVQLWHRLLSNNS